MEDCFKQMHYLVIVVNNHSPESVNFHSMLEHSNAETVGYILLGNNATKISSSAMSGLQVCLKHTEHVPVASRCRL